MTLWAIAPHPALPVNQGNGGYIWSHDTASSTSPCAPGRPREHGVIWSHDTASHSTSPCAPGRRREWWGTYDHMTLRAIHPTSPCAPSRPRERGVTMCGSLVWLSPLFMGFLALCIYVCGLVSCMLQTSALLVCLHHCNPKSGLGHFFNTTWSYTVLCIWDWTLDFFFCAGHVNGFPQPNKPISARY